MTLEEIEAWWNDKPEVDKLLKRPIFGYWEDVTNWLIQRVKELELELAKIKADPKEWIDKRSRSPVYEE